MSKEEVEVESGDEEEPEVKTESKAEDISNPDVITKSVTQRQIGSAAERRVS